MDGEGEEEQLDGEGMGERESEWSGAVKSSIGYLYFSYLAI